MDNSNGITDEEKKTNYLKFWMFAGMHNVHTFLDYLFTDNSIINILNILFFDDSQTFFFY